MFINLSAGLLSVAGAQEVPLSGRVTDPQGKPLQGVEVRILAGTWSDSTDVDGCYALRSTVSIGRSDQGSATRPGGAPALSIRPLPEGNQMITLRDSRGGLVSRSAPLAAGAWANQSIRPAGQDQAASATRPASAKPSAAAPDIWIQAFKPGYAVASKRVLSNTGTADFVLNPSTEPDFGPNVLIFDPTMPMAAIQSQVDKVFNLQAKAQFGAERFAFLFRPGAYALDVDVGYYTQVLGLGSSPDDVDIRGSVRSQTGMDQASTPGSKGTYVTQEFWRGVENLSITPTNPAKTVTWAVSQAAPFRRNHVRGGLNLSLSGWASGGYLANTKVDGTVQSGSQQQWFSRNTEWGNWSGGVWNMFFLGVTAPPVGAWPNTAYTVIPETPILREKPFLKHSAAAGWSLHLPALRKNTKGLNWDGSAGTDLPLGLFHVARPGPGVAASLNAALAAGKHLLLTPGIYYLDEPLRVTAPGAVVFGLGMATLVPTNGTAALELADEDGMTVSGIVIDAGPKESPVLFRVGPRNSSKDHAANPTVIHDVFFRVGGPRLGSAAVTMEVNSSGVLLDHLWIWRADHGNGVLWDGNRGKNGLVVRGKDVTAYGLFVEHFQEYQTLWEGENGRTYFYQCELPYDPPSQDLWQHDGVKGWAGYRVAPTVKTHAAHGLGVYSAFIEPVQSDYAIETPTAQGVTIDNAVAIWLDGADGSGINNVINTTGGAVTKTKTKATID